MNVFYISFWDIVGVLAIVGYSYSLSSAHRLVVYIYIYRQQHRHHE